MGVGSAWDVQRILKKADYYAQEIQEMLVNKTYIPSGYKEEKIWDGGNKKERIIRDYSQIFNHQ